MRDFPLSWAGSVLKDGTWDSWCGQNSSFSKTGEEQAFFWLWNKPQTKKKGLIPSDPHPVSVEAARTLQAGAAPMGRLSLPSPGPKYHCLY